MFWGKLLIDTQLNKNITVYGDKGYIMNQNKKQMIEKKKIELIVPKKEYKKKNYKTKNYISKRRIIVAHCNSVLHRSYKQLSKVNETKMIKIAISMIIINKVT